MMHLIEKAERTRINTTDTIDTTDTTPITIQCDKKKIEDSATNMECMFDRK